MRQPLGAALGDTEVRRTWVWLQKAQGAEVERGDVRSANGTSSLGRWKRGCPRGVDISPMSPHVGVAQGDPRSFLEVRPWVLKDGEGSAG